MCFTCWGRYCSAMQWGWRAIEGMGEGKCGCGRRAPGAGAAATRLPFSRGSLQTCVSLIVRLTGCRPHCLRLCANLCVVQSCWRSLKPRTKPRQRTTPTVRWARASGARAAASCLTGVSWVSCSGLLTGQHTICFALAAEVEAIVRKNGRKYEVGSLGEPSGIFARARSCL